MKICSSCNAQLKDEFKVCPYCGNSNFNMQFNFDQINNYQQNIEKKYNTSCIIGVISAIISLIVFPFIFGAVALVFASNGYFQAKQNNEKGKNIAIVSIIIGIFSIIWAILVAAGYINI